MGIIRYGDQQISVLWVRFAGGQRTDKGDAGHARQLAGRQNEAQYFGNEMCADVGRSHMLCLALLKNGSLMA